jgi:hypothetical protein
MKTDVIGMKTESSRCKQIHQDVNGLISYLGRRSIRMKTGKLVI